MENKTILWGVMNKLKLSDCSFTERIISQKTIYLLQEFGLQTTYDFKWYNYGVYSGELADAMFSSNPNQISITPLNPDSEEVINKLASFTGEDIKNPLFLEVASSILFIRKTNPLLKKDEVYEALLSKKPHLDNREQFDIIFEKLSI